MIDDEDRIREEAYKLWVGEGRPKGRAEENWAEAKEIVATRDSYKDTLRPADEDVDEPVEPAVAFENQSADKPGLDDLGNNQIGPTWDVARETAKLRPVEVEDAPPPKAKKRSAQRDEAKLKAKDGSSPQRA